MPDPSNKKTNVTIRMSKEILELARIAAQKRGETTSVLVRRAVLRELARLNLLPPEDKKFLAMTDD
jgi:hypothetical protein